MKRTSFVGIAAISLCLAAVPTFSQTSATAPSPQTASGQDASATVPTVTLEEALTVAEENGPSLKVARYTLGGAGAQLNQAQAKAGLSLSATGAYYHEDTLPGTSSATASSSGASSAAAQAAVAAGTASPMGENFQAGVSLAGPSTSVSLSAQHLLEEGSYHDQVSAFKLSGSQTLYDGYPGGRGAATLQEAEYAYRVALVTYDSQALNIAFQVKQAYYTLLGDQHVVLVQEANVSQATEDLARTEAFLKADQATQLDVLQAQIALRQAQLSLRTARNQVVVDRKNLSLAIGWPLDKDYSVAETPAPPIPTLDPSQALKIAFENRPELKELALSIASGNVALSLSKSAYYPVVAATGSVALNQDWTANFNSGTYTAGIAVSLPVFQNGLLSAQVKQAQAQLDSLKVQQVQEQHSITIAVQSALFAITQDNDNLSLSQQSVAAAQGQYDLEKAKFAAGLATNLDVLQASAAFMSAESSLEQAKNAYSLAILNLNIALGL